MSPTPLLDLAHLEVVYHGVVRVLTGVNLHIAPGEIVALLGPNGAGKTTTLRAITGLLALHEGRVTKGHVHLDGHRIDPLDPPAIVARGVAQVMEGRRILAELTVEENLRAGATGAPRRRIRDDLDRHYARFPILGERRHRPAGYLSGGEQQMLAIARALMSHPRLLLLDEPSLGLAPRIVQDVAALIRDINQQGTGVLLVEQNAAMALSLCHRGYLIENGQIVLEGTAAALREDDDVREFYLGLGGGEATHSYREIKHYRRRKRWLS
ncbi:MAG: ABC transporter ATP-binding protein [Myxococcales bacterium]|nr:ABC transporter ATP-binding protein [Myxococcales bacterium]